MNLPPFLRVHTVTVEPLTGETSTGADAFGDPYDLSCMAQGGLRRVRTVDGDTITVALTLYADPGVNVPTGSRVTWDGGVYTVLQTIPHDDGGLGAPQHTEVVCQ